MGMTNVQIGKACGNWPLRVKEILRIEFNERPISYRGFEVCHYDMIARH